MNEVVLEKNNKYISILLVISILNFAIWLFTGWIFFHKHFAEYEIMIPMLMLILNTIVALTTFVFGTSLLGSNNKLKTFITLIISASQMSVVFAILYRDWSLIINMLSLA